MIEQMPVRKQKESKVDDMTDAAKEAVFEEEVFDRTIPLKSIFGLCYHCRMILPTARRRGICIRTLGRRLRKDSTKERPSVNDGGTRKKKRRQEKLRESNLGVYLGVMVAKLKTKGWPKFTHTYESAEEPPRTEKKAAEEQSWKPIRGGRLAALRGCELTL